MLRCSSCTGACCGYARDHPDLRDPNLDDVTVEFNEDVNSFRVRRGHFDVIANLADHPQTAPAHGHLILATEPETTLTGGQLRMGPASAAIIERA